MPKSVFLHRSLDSAMDATSNVAILQRNALLSCLPERRPDGPVRASTCYVWPTSDCPVGCSHCNFAAPPQSSALGRYRIADHLPEVLQVVNGMHLWKAVLSGGGEPMVEPEFCRAFIQGVDSPCLEEIELITSGQFASSDRAADEQLDQLIGAWRARPGRLHPAELCIRLSLDWFHARRIGIEPAVRIVHALGQSQRSDVTCYVRSVLLENDTTIEEFAAALGGQLGPVSDYQRDLALPDGRHILIYYKNLIFDGRMTRRRMSNLPVKMHSDSHVSAFGERFRRADGRHVPARVYNGPEVRQLDGLACVVEDDGAIKILEGNDPNRYPKLSSFGSWEAVIRYLYADPLTGYLVNHGPEGLAGLISDEYPEAVTHVTDTNQLYYLVDRILADPVTALYATLKTIQSQGDARPGTVREEAALRESWDVWRSLRQERAAAS